MMHDGIPHNTCVQVLPRVAAEVSGPMSRVSKVTMVAGAEGGVGPSRVAGEVIMMMMMITMMMMMTTTMMIRFWTSWPTSRAPSPG